MIRFSLVLFSFLFCVQAYTQNEEAVLKIKADLIDDEGKHVNDVHVTVNGTPYDVTSRKWSFEMLKDSVYRVEFSKRGYIGKVIVIDTHHSFAEKHVFPFDLVLNAAADSVWATYYKPISHITYSNYKHKFIYDKSQAIKRQREIYNCKLDQKDD